MDSSPSISSRRVQRSQTLKRGVDVIGALCLGAITAPLWILAFAGIKITSPGPAFFVARRVGRGGEPFAMYKFRTMRVNDGRGPAITSPSDSRIFPFGAFLRASKIDELPQLLNILMGQVSFVGPRPEDPRIVERFYDAELRRSLELTPGMTSVGTLYYMRHFTDHVSASDSEQSYADNILRKKLRMDMDYAERDTMLTDLALIVRTGFAVSGAVIKKTLKRDFDE